MSNETKERLDDLKQLEEEIKDDLFYLEMQDTWGSGGFKRMSELQQQLRDVRAEIEALENGKQ